MRVYIYIYIYIYTIHTYVCLCACGKLEARAPASQAFYRDNVQTNKGFPRWQNRPRSAISGARKWRCEEKRRGTARVSTLAARASAGTMYKQTKDLVKGGLAMWHVLNLNLRIERGTLCVTMSIVHMSRIPFGDHPLTLERYRED